MINKNVIKKVVEHIYTRVCIWNVGFNSYHWQKRFETAFNVALNWRVRIPVRISVYIHTILVYTDQKLNLELNTVLEEWWLASCNRRVTLTILYFHRISNYASQAAYKDCVARDREIGWLWTECYKIFWMPIK